MNRLALALLLSLSTAVHAQETKSYPTRMEVHAIQSLTLSDDQFLQGDAAAGRPVTVTGVLQVAQGQGRLPVVVMIHGSGGIGANAEMWSRDFNEIGVSTFTLDGFTGRGLTSVAPDQALLGRLNMSLDVYRVLEILAKHPRVDPQRIVLMGFSRGGQGALYASLKRFHRQWNRSGIEFAAYIPLYPDCMTTYREDTDVVDKPIRIHHGTPDDFNPVANCKAYVERLRAVGRDVQLFEYPNAAHAYDNQLVPSGAVPSTNSQTVRKCRIQEDEKGRLINAASGQPFSYKDACVERDPHVGHDAAATQTTRKSVREFVRAVFKLS